MQPLYSHTVHGSLVRDTAKFQAQRTLQTYQVICTIMYDARI